MKSARIYLFKSELINFVNLLQFCFLLSREEDLYYPCRPKFDQQHLSIDPGKLAIMFTPENPYSDFRSIDWTCNITALDSILQNTSQSVPISHFSIEQIDFLKNTYLDDALSISCYYDEDLYDLLLTYATHSHISKQNSGKIPITEFDQELRDSSVDLFDYYKNAFDKQNLVAKKSFYETDYAVPLLDFFNKDKFFWHVESIGGKQTEITENYYDTWRNVQKSFFNEEQT